MQRAQPNQCRPLVAGTCLVLMLSACGGTAAPSGSRADSTADAVNPVSHPLPEASSTMTQTLPITALAQLRGAPYLAERDRLFREEPDLLALAQGQVDGPDWEVRVQAKILVGWLVDHDLFRTVLMELDAVDVEWEGSTAVGLSRIWDKYQWLTENEYHERILPLAWESLLKLSDQYPNWKLVAFLHMLAGMPSDESVEPVVELILRTDRPAVRSAAAKVLTKLPRVTVTDRLDAVETRDAEVQQAITQIRRRLQ